MQKLAPFCIPLPSVLPFLNKKTKWMKLSRWVYLDTGRCASKSLSPVPYINHLPFTAFSVHDDKKASLPSFKSDIVHGARISFMKIINEESAEVYFPFTEDEMWIVISEPDLNFKKLHHGSEFAGRLERLFAAYNSHFFVCVFRTVKSSAWFRGLLLDNCWDYFMFGGKGGEGELVVRRSFATRIRRFAKRKIKKNIWD